MISAISEYTSGCQSEEFTVNYSCKIRSSWVAIRYDGVYTRSTAQGIDERLIASLQFFKIDLTLWSGQALENGALSAAASLFCDAAPSG